MSDVVIDQHLSLAAQGTIDNLPGFEGSWGWCSREMCQEGRRRLTNVDSHP